MHFTESLSSPLSHALGRDRQLHKQALVITALPILAVVPLSLNPLLSFAVCFCLFSPHFPHYFAFPLISPTSSMCQYKARQSILFGSNMLLGAQHLAIQWLRQLRLETVKSLSYNNIEYFNPNRKWEIFYFASICEYVSNYQM